MMGFLCMWSNNENWSILSAIVVVGLFFLSSFGITYSSVAAELNQVQATATPRRVSLPSATPFPTSGATPTPTYTLITEEATPEVGVQLQALEAAGEINVRLQGDINSEIVGTIQFGETYQVTGRFFRWYQIVFDPSPTGQAFVFEDLVEIVSGDLSSIPDLTIPDAANDVSTVVTETANEATETDSIANNTQDAREITPPSGEGVAVSSEENSVDVLPGVLPTYTYPPDFDIQATQPEEADVDEENTSETQSNSFAPITPILILGALGGIGLLLSSLRR